MNRQPFFSLVPFDAVYAACPTVLQTHGRGGLLSLVASISLCFGQAHPVSAQEREPHVFSTILENDFLYNPAPGSHQDRHYTQGLKLIYLDRGEPVPGWARLLLLNKVNDVLPTVWLNARTANFGLILGQNIYTPEDDQTQSAIPTDRPYAAWLYLGLAIQRRGETAGHIPVLESFELDLGVIGPEAQGQFAQDTWHDWRHIATFEGWDNQLKTEPAFGFRYGRAWSLALSEQTRRYFDVIPNLGFDLGTVRVSGNLGVTTRLGWNLPDDFGVQTIDSPIVLSNGRERGPIGLYIFGQVEGRAVARNAFLDGNLYQESAHIRKQPFVADFIYGLGLTVGKHFEASWSFLTRTPEFDGQNGNDQFASLMVKFKCGF